MLYHAAMLLSLIAAADENNVIGQDNKIPWYLPDDWKYFRAKTKGHPIVMGRKTYESIGRPLPDRLNIVISRNADFKAEGCVVVHSFHDAVELAKRDATDEVFVIGGQQIYEAAMPEADRIYLTRTSDPATLIFRTCASRNGGKRRGKTIQPMKSMYFPFRT